MSEYTPTTEQVREVWAAFSDYGGLVDREQSGLHDDRQAEFDRWLAQVRAETTATTEDVARVPHRDELAEVVLAATLPHLGPGGQTAPYVKPVHYAMVDALLARFHITERQ